MSKNNRANRANKQRKRAADAKRPKVLDARTPRQLAPGHYLPVDPRLTDIECPDCGANWTAPEPQRKPGAGGALDHAPTCPIGKGYADAADDDREWFAANPDETERVRPPTMAELQAVMLSTGQALPDMPNGCAYEPGGLVTVTKISDVLRQRDFRNAILLAAPALSPADGLHPDEFDETGQLWFREHLGPSRLPEE